MKKLFAACAALALIGLPALAQAQAKEIPGDMVTKTVTIEAIDHGARELTVKQEDGTYQQFTVSKDVTRFDQLKVGDKVTAKYYTNLVLRMKQPGEKDVDSATAAETKAPRPGGTVARQRTITATITHIDMNAPSVTFKGPNNWTYSSKVQDKKALAKVKVGDKVDITWTEAVLLDVAPPEKK